MQYEGTPFYDSLSSVFKKIEDSLPEKAALQVSHEDTRFTVFPPPGTVISHEVWETVFNALRLLQKLKITYKTPGRSATVRELDPYHAIRYDCDWYVIGHCHLRNKVRTFSLSRIMHASMGEASFALPDDFNFQQITSSRFGVHWGEAEEQVKIWFTPEAAPYVLERKWHPSQDIKNNKDGSITLWLRVNHLLELKRWVLSWGKDARVLAPEKLIQDISSEIAHMAGAYAG